MLDTGPLTRDEAAELITALLEHKRGGQTGTDPLAGAGQIGFLAVDDPRAPVTCRECGYQGTKYTVDRRGCVRCRTSG